MNKKYITVFFLVMVISFSMNAQLKIIIPKPIVKISYSPQSIKQGQVIQFNISISYPKGAKKSNKIDVLIDLKGINPGRPRTMMKTDGSSKNTYKFNWKTFKTGSHKIGVRLHFQPPTKEIYVEQKFSVTAAAQPSTAPLAKKKLKITPQKAKIKLATKVKAYYMMGAIGDTVPIKGKLTLNNGKALPNQPLRFYVDGKYLNQVKTDSNGMAKTMYNVPDKFGAKKTLVKFEGSKSHMPSSDTATFGTIKSSTKIAVSIANPNLPRYGGSPVFISGYLKRITDEKGIYGREIEISVNGTLVKKAATSSYGKFDYSYTIPGNFVGNIKITARFNGDTLYSPNVASFTFQVHPPKSKAYLFWYGTRGKVGQTVSVKAILSHVRTYTAMEGIGGKKIRIWRYRGKEWGGVQVPSKTLGAANTNSAGVAKITFKIDDNAMGYSLGAHVDGVDHEFILEKIGNGSIYSPRYDVSKSPVHIDIAGPTSAKIADKLMFTVRVSRTTDNDFIKDIIVKFPDGQTKKTTHLGSAVFFYTIPPAEGTGPRTIKVTSAETKKYLAGTANKAITIFPKDN